MKIQLRHTFADMVSAENLLAAWEEFARGKRGKRDVQEFSLRLMDNILALHADLCNRTYRHGGYKHFKVCDPKPRDIHKATVRDRLVHHAIYRVLYPFFERTFIADSYSCRLRKGTHKALARFRQFGCAVSKNNTKTCWILKGDIRKFFANIDHAILLNTLRQYIPDQDILWLLENVIGSFNSVGRSGIGLPLGNLTSQLLVNIYMNRFDQFVKHRLRTRQYARYADDFVIFSDNRNELVDFIPVIREFLSRELHLALHPQKIYIATLASGMDFLGWVHFPDHRILRAATRRRMMRRIRDHATPQSMQSYLGLLRHGNTYAATRRLEKQYFLSIAP